MKADLHCHTVLSDGAMRVDQIMPYAKRIGLDYIAISDHESTHSIPEAVRLGKELGVHAIPAVEANAWHEGHRRMFSFTVIIRCCHKILSVIDGWYPMRWISMSIPRSKVYTYHGSFHDGIYGTLC
ncbi:MAG: PHP domain-containing protein [Anaerostipes hadrus]